jgi:hypothetical protein
MPSSSSLLQWPKVEGVHARTIPPKLQTADTLMGKLASSCSPVILPQRSPSCYKALSSRSSSIRTLLTMIWCSESEIEMQRQQLARGTCLQDFQSDKKGFLEFMSLLSSHTILVLGVTSIICYVQLWIFCEKEQLLRHGADRSMINTLL